MAVLLALLGFLAHRYSRPERVFSTLASAVKSNLGADLAIDGAPHFSFLPAVAGALPKPRLLHEGREVLRAESLHAALPWRSIWGERIDIERIELEQPVLDLDALRALLAAQPPSTSQTPDVRVAVRIHGGTLHAEGRELARGIDLDLVNSGDLAAWLTQWSARDATLPPARGQTRIERIETGGVTLEDVRIELRETPAMPPRSTSPQNRP